MKPSLLMRPETLHWVSQFAETQYKRYEIQVLRGAFDRIASKIGPREERIVGRMLQDKLHDRTVAAEQVTKRLVAVEDSCKKNP